jgi:outer membrane PBP1 activator LpoA protein
MGFDAYRLVPDLASGSALAGAEHAGVTGQLYLSGSRQVHRRLSWARIVGGRPQPLRTLSVMEPATPIEVGE